jgi:hypothetical protein
MLIRISEAGEMHLSDLTDHTLSLFSEEHNAIPASYYVHIKCFNYLRSCWYKLFQAGECICLS